MSTLTEKIHENTEKNRRLDLVEAGEIKVTEAERDELDNWWIEHADDLNDALEDAGILVMGKVSWFPHPQWRDRVPILGLSEENTRAVIDYVEEHYENSITFLEDLECFGAAQATTAYAKRCKQKGIVFEQPDADLSGVEVQDGALVVVLRNVNGELARYEATARWKDYEYDDFKLRYVEPEEPLGIRREFYRMKEEAA